MNSTAVVYKSGNSKVITLPAWMGLEVGDKVRLKKSDKGVVLEKTKVLTKKSSSEMLRKQLGRHPGITQGMNARELDELLEGVYE